MRVSVYANKIYLSVYAYIHTYVHACVYAYTLIHSIELKPDPQSFKCYTPLII